MKKIFLFMLFFSVSLLLSAKTEKSSFISYKCDGGKNFKIRKINDDTVEIRTYYSVARLKKVEQASSEIYNNRNYELGLLDDAAYLNIFGYFSAWNSDFYTHGRNSWNNSMYVNEFYRGCKVNDKQKK